MLRQAVALLLFSALPFTACRSRDVPPVDNVGGSRDVSRFALTSLKGTRDGDRLRVQAAYGDQSQSLKLDLHFRVTPPTQLDSGTWSGLDGEGSVQQRSVTFLGGQSGSPSIGGRFDLIGPDRRTLYRVTIPLQELKQRL